MQSGFLCHLPIASMRPPEFTGGNAGVIALSATIEIYASMRPPEFTGGNSNHDKLMSGGRLASMRPPEFTGGNVVELGAEQPQQVLASMRPPEFTGGNGRCGAAHAA